MNIIKFIKSLFTRKKSNEQSSKLEADAKPYEPISMKKREKYHESISSYSSPTRKPQIKEDDSDFLTSMAIANATDSAALGTLIGGDPLGAMVGDMMNSSDDNSHSSFDNDSFSSDSFSSDSSSSDYSSSDYSSSDSSSSDY